MLISFHAAFKFSKWHKIFMFYGSLFREKVKNLKMSRPTLKCFVVFSTDVSFFFKSRQTLNIEATVVVTRIKLW